MRLAMYMKLTNQLYPNSTESSHQVMRSPNGYCKMDKWKKYTFYRHPHYDETKLIILHTPMPKREGDDRRWIIYHTEKGALYECRFPNRLAHHLGPGGLQLKGSIDVSKKDSCIFWQHYANETLAVNLTEDERRCSIQTGASC